MAATLSNATVYARGRCGVDLYSTLTISICLGLAAVLNTLHCFTLYKTRSSTTYLLRIQSLLLANISISSLVACLVTLPLVAVTYFTSAANHRCHLSRRFAAIFWLAPQSCNFIACAELTIFRYLTCRFPLKCEVIMTPFKVTVSIIVMWIVSYFSITLGSLLDNSTSFEYPIYPINKYSGIAFIVFYFSNMVILATVNLVMWLMGHTAYRRDRAARRTVSTSRPNSQVVVQRNNLKIAFVSLILPVKNIILFLPPVVIELLFEAGYGSLNLRETRALFGPVPAMSHMLDPLICIFLVQQTKSYMKRKLRQIGDYLRVRLNTAIGMVTSSRLGQNVVVPAEEHAQER